MFTELQPLLSTVTSLTLSMVLNTDGSISVTVIPKGAKLGCPLDTPLPLTGTAAELDVGFAGMLTSYAAKRQDLSDQLAATEAILDAAKKEAADKAKKSIAKPAKSSTPVATDEDEDDGSDDDEDDESASHTAPASTVSTSTPVVAASDASDLWA